MNNSKANIFFLALGLIVLSGFVHASSVISTITTGGNPNRIAINPSGTLLYATQQNSNAVNVINIATNTVVNTIIINNASDVDGVAFSPSGTFAYVDNFYGNLYVIDVATNSVVNTINLNSSISNPVDIAFNPSGTLAYVPMWSGKVAVIDVATNGVVKNIGGSGINLLIDVAFNSAGTLAYVTDYGEGGSQQLLVINVSTNTIINTITTPGAEYGLALNPTGSLLYVVNQNNDSISVINTATDAVINTINVGLYPIDVVFSSSGSFAYVDNYRSNNVSVIDVSANSVVDTINVGSGPTGMMANPAGTLLYVANNQAGTLSVINQSSTLQTPTISISPTNQSLDTSQTISIKATLTNQNLANYKYQWYNASYPYPGAPTKIPGANTLVYSATAGTPRELEATETYDYYIAITNSSNSTVNSSIASVTVYHSPEAYVAANTPVGPGQTIEIKESDDPCTLTRSCDHVGGGILQKHYPGFGNDTYRWYNTTTGTSVYTGESTQNYTAIAGASGTFSYYVTVTDSDNETARANISITVTPLPTTSTTTTIVPLPQLHNVSINLTNYQNSSTGQNFQQMISFNPALYQASEAGNLGNIRFYQGSNELYSWCESGCSSSAQNAIFWVKLPAGIGSDGSIMLNMLFLPANTQYDSVHAGEAPQLSPSYGEYDNGAQIFSLYDNFTGYALGPQWVVFSGNGGGNITVDNGLKLTTTTSTASYIGIRSSNLLSPEIFESDITNSSNGELGETYIGYATNTFTIGDSDPNNFGPNGYLAPHFYGGGWPLHLAIQESSNGSILANGSSSASSGVVSLAFPKGGLESFAINYTNLGNSTNSTYAYGEMYTYILQNDNTNAGPSLTSTYQWARIRLYPPNGVMPSVSFTSNINSTIATTSTTVSTTSTTITQIINGTTSIAPTSSTTTVAPIINGTTSTMNTTSTVIPQLPSTNSTTKINNSTITTASSFNASEPFTTKLSIWIPYQWQTRNVTYPNSKFVQQTYCSYFVLNNQSINLLTPQPTPILANGAFYNTSFNYAPTSSQTLVVGGLCRSENITYSAISGSWGNWSNITTVANVSTIVKSGVPPINSNPLTNFWDGITSWFENLVKSLGL